MKAYAMVFLALVGMLARADAEDKFSAAQAKAPALISVYSPEQASAGHWVRFSKWLDDPDSLESVPLYAYALDDVCIRNTDASWFRTWWADLANEVGKVVLVAKTERLKQEELEWMPHSSSPAEYVGIPFEPIEPMIHSDRDSFTRNELCQTLSEWNTQYSLAHEEPIVEDELVRRFMDGVLEQTTSVEGKPDYFVAVEYPFVDVASRQPYWADFSSVVGSQAEGLQ